MDTFERKILEDTIYGLRALCSALGSRSYKESLLVEADACFQRAQKGLKDYQRNMWETSSDARVLPARQEKP